MVAHGHGLKCHRACRERERERWRERVCTREEEEEAYRTRMNLEWWCSTICTNSTTLATWLLFEHFGPPTCYCAAAVCNEQTDQDATCYFRFACERQLTYQPPLEIRLIRLSMILCYSNLTKQQFTQTSNFTAIPIRSHCEFQKPFPNWNCNKSSIYPKLRKSIESSKFTNQTTIGKFIYRSPSSIYYWFLSNFQTIAILKLNYSQRQCLYL